MSGRARRDPGRGKNHGRKKRSEAAKARRGRKGPPIRASDPSDTPESETRYVQPYEALKTYLCPGCNREIPPGTGHMVAIPPDDPDLRRHWHRGCWNNRASRR